MGTWTTTTQTVESWSAPVETAEIHFYVSGVVNWYVKIRFYIGRRVTDKAVVIRADLYGAKASGWQRQNVQWVFGAKRKAEAGYTDTSRSGSTNSTSYENIATAYYVDAYRGSTTYNLRFSAELFGTWRYYEISIDSSGVVRLKIDGEWKEAEPFVKVNGEWKEAQPFVKVGGEWREGT